MRITNDLTCAIPFENAQGDKAELFIAHLDSARFNAAYKVLGKAYSMLKTGEVHPDVFCVDYKELFKDDSDILNPFLEYHFTNAMIISNGILVDFKEAPDKVKADLQKAEIDDDCLDSVRGLFFFIAALLRYANKATIMSFGELCNILQTAQQWRISHESSLSMSQTDSDSNKGADKIVNI